MRKPDRGPNALVYNTAVDNTTTYIPRFQSLHLSLAPSTAGAPLPFVLTPFVTDTTLLSSVTPLHYGDGKAFGLPNGAPALNSRRKALYYFTGRSDNFDPQKPSTNPDIGTVAKPKYGTSSSQTTTTSSAHSSTTAIRMAGTTRTAGSCSPSTPAMCRGMTRSLSRHRRAAAKITIRGMSGSTATTDPIPL